MSAPTNKALMDSLQRAVERIVSWSCNESDPPSQEEIRAELQRALDSLTPMPEAHAGARHRCIRPQCPVNCTDCNHAIPADDELAMLVKRLLDTLAVDGYGCPFEDEECSVVAEARAWLARYNSRAAAAPDAGVQPSDWRSGAVVLTAAQLHEALAFIAPDFNTDEDQRETEVSIAYAPDGAVTDDDDQPQPAGLVAWLTDYPEEGVFPLTLPDAYQPTPHQPAPQAVEAKAPELTAAARDVLVERSRQVEAKGYSHPHDDEHVRGEIADAAAEWLLTGQHVTSGWAREKRKHTRRRQLVIGAALALAEIERLDRTAPAAGLSQRDGGDA